MRSDTIQAKAISFLSVSQFQHTIQKIPPFSTFTSTSTQIQEIGKGHFFADYVQHPKRAQLGSSSRMTANNAHGLVGANQDSIILSPHADGGIESRTIS